MYHANPTEKDAAKCDTKTQVSNSEPFHFVFAISTAETADPMGLPVEAILAKASVEELEGAAGKTIFPAVCAVVPALSFGFSVGGSLNTIRYALNPRIIQVQCKNTMTEHAMPVHMKSATKIKPKLVETTLLCR